MIVLVVGAQHGSLGEAISLALKEEGHSVVTWGISGHEQERVDLREHGIVRRRMARFVEMPEAVVCTVGINREGHDVYAYRDHFTNNVEGPINLLHEYVDQGAVQGDHFVAISSNSAHIARRNSGPYCASKAALSMALRVSAREYAERADRPIVYGYEFGLLCGTPMTEDAEARFDGPLTRMPGLPKGIPVSDAAGHVVRNLLHGKEELNGVMLRLDAGEQ